MKRRSRWSRMLPALVLAAGLPAAAPAQSGVWTNLLGGSWNDPANWNGGVIADGADNTADFATLDIAATRTVTLDANRTIGNLLFADTATAAFGWALNAGTPAGILTLDVSAGAPVIDVATQTLTIAAQVAGDDGLTKTGRGTLSLTASNSYSGLTSILGGRLAVNNNHAFGASPTVLLRAGSGTGYAYLDMSAGMAVSNKTLVLSGYDSNNRAILRAAGANAVWAGDIIVAATNHNLNLLQTDAANFIIGGNITNDGGANAGLQLRGGGTGLIYGDIRITGALNKNDGGTWTLYGTNNLWTSMAVSQGILKMGAPNVCVATAAVTWATDKTILTLDLNGFDQTVRGLSAGTIYSGKVVSATSATLTIDTAGSTYTSLAAIQGAISLVKDGAGVQSLQNTNTWTGSTLVRGGTLRSLREDILPDATDVTLAGGILDLGSLNDTVRSLTFSSVAGGLSNAVAAGKALSLASTDAALVWTVNKDVSANFALTATDVSRVVVTGFSGGAASLDGLLNLGVANRIFDVEDVNPSGPDFYLNAQVSGGGGFVKTGAGTVSISNVFAHAGPTIVSNGTLSLRGAAAPTNSPVIAIGAGATLDASGLSSTMRLKNGQTLKGAGAFEGGLIVESGATVSPGSSPGVLTLQDSLTLESGSTFAVELNGMGPGAGYDQLEFLGGDDTLTLNSPTLSVSDSAPFAPASVFIIVTGFQTLAGDGQFAGLADGDTVTTANNQYQVDYDATSVTLTVVPEPATYGLLGLAAALGALLRRSRGRIGPMAR